jgi:hypothetical protein
LNHLKNGSFQVYEKKIMVIILLDNKINSD